MSLGTTASQLLRGVPLDAAPVRLAAATGAAQPLRDPIVVAAEAEFQHAREQALRAGHEDGLRTGRAEGLRQGRAEAAAQARTALEKAVEEAVRPLQAEQQRLRELGDSLQAAVADAVHAAHDEMIALAFEAICRILGDHALRPDTVRAQLAQLVARHATRETVAVHVHPQDRELLADALPDTPWIADPEVALGGCMLRGTAGALDARLETMLAACRAVLLQARASGASTGAGA